MKTKILQIGIALLFICFGFTKDDKKTRFEIRKDNPAIGLTLGWALPEAELQKIVGDKFKPAVKDGKGFFMLFITTAKKYYINDLAYDNLKMAHLIIPVVGKYTINAPLSIGNETQKINGVLKYYDFKIETGNVDLVLTHKTDSITLMANIITSKGKIELNSTFLNKLGELKHIDSTIVSATANPNSFFTGPESYKPINIETIKISNVGQNWISQFNLSAKPDRVWMNDAFVWDFIFMRKLQ